MKTKSSANLTEPIYNHILNMILNQELQPGERIPEVPIAEELGVSRTPVRNALKQLENEGIVVIHPNRFVQVAEFNEEKIQNLGIMRIAIDTMAVRLAIFRGSNEDFFNLRQIADKCIDKTSGNENINKLDLIHNDYLFHQQLGILSRNPILEKYQYQFLRQMEVMLSYNYIDVMSASISHNEIVDAMEARDDELAAKLMSEHIAEFYHIRDSFPFLFKNSVLPEI